ncbi:MAG: hypothetical protein EXS35_03820 [Pedosphaera sp.]|nr:hypothetical protein [Pedosphaera sp.]
MKKILFAIVASAMCAWFAGCQTARPAADIRPRFHEGASADVVLHFHRWDTIYMLRPDTRQGGFLPFFTRDGVKVELADRQPVRDLAVVILGYNFSPEIEAGLVRDWTQFLSAEKFKRVVLVRAGWGHEIDGLLIIRDSAIAAADDKGRPTAEKLAALAPAAGANVADSSGR